MTKTRKPTSTDIAYRAGVSQPTVSRALRNSPEVSEETRRRVQAIAKELNYKVDISARNLRSQDTKTIALLLCEDPGTGESLINPFFVSMLASITRASAKNGYDLLISFQQLSNDWNADYEDAHRADGIIFLGYGDYVTYIEKIGVLDEAGAHFVTWGPILPGQPGHFIGSDNQAGGALATRHLVSMGRKNIAFIGDASEHNPEFRQRFEGYRRVLTDEGLEIDSSLYAAARNSEVEGYNSVQKVLATAANVDAIFCASDLLAIGAMRALNENRLSVPTDIAIVGFDDLPMMSSTSPPLTTVRQDTAVAGEKLIEMLLNLISGANVESELLPTSLVVRESCGAGAIL